MTLDADQALLALIALGDQAAFGRLYEHYCPRLRRYLWHQLDHNLPLVEEVLQEVFLAVWRMAEGYQGKAKVATWLFQITHYQVIHARNQHQLCDLSFEEDVATIDGAWFIPEETDDIIDRLITNAALLQLSSKHREALDLLIYQRFTMQEIAAILHVPVGTVKSRISYGRKALTRLLSGGDQ